VLREAAALPRLSGRSSQSDSALMAASVAEQKTVETEDELLRFVQRDNANTGR
jgi:hypothetical protein